MKHYYDEKKIDKRVLDARNKLSFFYLKLLNVEIFANVDINCFKKRSTIEIEMINIVEKAQKKKIDILVLFSHILSSSRLLLIDC